MPNGHGFLPPSVDELLDHRAIRSAIDLSVPAATVPVSSAVDTELRGLW